MAYSDAFTSAILGNTNTIPRTNPGFGNHFPNPYQHQQRMGATGNMGMYFTPNMAPPQQYAGYSTGIPNQHGMNAMITPQYAQNQYSNAMQHQQPTFKYGYAYDEPTYAQSNSSTNPLNTQSEALYSSFNQASSAASNVAGKANDVIKSKAFKNVASSVISGVTKGVFNSDLISNLTG